MAQFWLRQQEYLQQQGQHCQPYFLRLVVDGLPNMWQQRDQHSVRQRLLIE